MKSAADCMSALSTGGFVRVRADDKGSSNDGSSAVAGAAGSMVMVPEGVDDEDVRGNRSVSLPVSVHGSPVMGSRHENQEAVAQLRQVAVANYKSLMQIAAAVEVDAVQPVQAQQPAQ